MDVKLLRRTQCVAIKLSALFVLWTLHGCCFDNDDDDLINARQVSNTDSLEVIFSLIEGGRGDGLRFSLTFRNYSKNPIEIPSDWLQLHHGFVEGNRYLDVFDIEKFKYHTADSNFMATSKMILINPGDVYSFVIVAGDYQSNISLSAPTSFSVRHIKFPKEVVHCAINSYGQYYEIDLQE